MNNLSFILTRIEDELKNHNSRLGEPIYCILKVGPNSYTYSQQEVPEELAQYFSKTNKIFINGDDHESCNYGLLALKEVANYYRNKKK